MINKTYRSLPPQRVPRSKKNKEWQKASVDAILSMADSSDFSGPNNKEALNRNYDAMNSKFDESDFDYVLNPYGAKGKFGKAPTKMRNYNVIRTKIEALKGEEMKLPFNFRAVAVDGEAVSEKRKARNEAIKQAVIQTILSGVQPEVDENGQPIQPPTPEQVDKLFTTNYVNPTEVTANQLLKWLYKYDSIQTKFAQGWEHALISARECYNISIKNGHPSLRVCNALQLEYDKEHDSPFIQDGVWAREERWVPVGTIVDEYGEYLSDADVKALDEGSIVNEAPFSNNQLPGFMYDMDGGVRTSNSKNPNRPSHVYVANVCWRSFRRMGFLTYFDENTGEMEETIVSDGFKLSADMRSQGAALEWKWSTEIWEGTRIGADIYCNIHPLPNQINTLPFVGYVYNNVNSEATSLVDLIMPHQYTYMVTWWRLEQELAKAKGRKFIMDMAQMPKSNGWTMDQWMYYFDNLGVIWINSMEEGRKGDPNTIAKFNQFQSIDVSLSQVVGQYMQVLDKIEEQIINITGVAPQREGQIGSSETATGAQRAIIQSTNVTKPLFFYHDKVKEAVLSHLIESAKVAYIDGIELENILDEVGVETIKVDGGKLNATDLGVFITNSTDELEKIEKLEQLGQVALQQDKAKLTDLITIIESKSLSEIKSVIRKSEADKIAEQQQQQQQANEATQQAAKTNQETEMAKQEHEDARSERELETRVLIAKIGKGDGDDEGAIAEQTKLALEVTKESNRSAEEASKLKLEETKHKDDVMLKKKELEIKKADTAIKARTANNKAVSNS